MTGDWLALLIDPSRRIGRRAREIGPAPALGVAILLEVRLSLYRALGPEHGWPQLGLPYVATGDGAADLLGALSSQLAGHETATALYRETAEDRSNPSDLRTVAAILGGIALADAGQPAAAIDQLDHLLPDVVDKEERSLLLLHAGVRLAETGAYEEALARTQLAMDESRSVKRSASSAQVVRVVGSHNRWQFEQRLGVRSASPFALPSRSDIAALTRVDLLAEEGLSKFFDRQFETSLQSPYARTVRFEAFDEVEAALLGALLRAESLADWTQILRLRRSLGRYEITSKVGLAERSFEVGFDLLRRAGDADGIERSARLVRTIGPLESLRAAAAGSLATSWTQETEAAQLRLLEYGADLLQPKEAEAAARRIVESDVLRRVTVAAAPALSNLLAATPKSVHRDVAAQLLHLAQTEDDALVLQSLPRIVAALRWGDVPVTERRKWLTFVRKHLSETSSQAMVAHTVASTLGRLMLIEVSKITTAAMNREPSLELAAILVNIDADVPDETWEEALRVAQHALNKIRADAQQGSYAFGSLNVGALTAELLRKKSTRAIWDALTGFLLDPRVGAGDKTDALNRISRTDIRIPRDAANALRRALPDVSAVYDALSTAPELYEAARLRLAVRLDAVGQGQLLARLLRLAAGHTALARIAAADLIPSTRRLLGQAATLPVALLLAADNDADVRAHAANALGAVAPSAAPFAAQTTERLLELLAEPNAFVPAATIAGLVTRHRDGAKLPAKLVEAVRRLSKRHSSRQVRENADVLLRELDLR
jgi:hypothetical protein